MEAQVLLRHHHVSEIENIDVYMANEGYQGLSSAAQLNADQIIRLVEEAGLRGRGGAGFPTARKWRAVASQQNQPHYLICNIAEGEPGSFKDRELLKNPHQALESTAIAAYAVGAEKAFLYLRGIFIAEESTLKEALTQAQNRRLLGKEGVLPVELVIHRGEDSYIVGEETAMIESLEGKRAIPRTKPPRPHEYGLWNCPTVVNNMETLCNVIPIVLYGAQVFRRWGTVESPGTKLFCLSGQIRNPGVYELPMGIRLSKLLNDSGGGPLPGRRFLGVFPGGPSTPFLPFDLDPALDFESLQEAGSALGTGGMIVLDDSSDIPTVAVEISKFFAAESCEACPPCTFGTSETHRLFLELKKKPQNSAETVLKIREICEMMKFRGQCAHNRSAAHTLLSLLNHFPTAFVSS
jgi:NADH-quinone oxidoreductase subunit F